MSWIITLIFGGIVGWLASIVMKTNAQMGLIANVLIGVLGSMSGFWIAGLLGIAPVGGILRFLIAIAGAVLFWANSACFERSNAGRAARHPTLNSNRRAPDFSFTCGLYQALSSSTT